MAPPERVVFGPFEVDLAAVTLLKRGLRIRLSGQPFRILALLVSRPGQVISQEELRKEIWGDGTFVDFEHSVYAAMNKLRSALCDSAENPRYIETLPGRGYRFIGVLNPAPLPLPIATAPVAETKQAPATQAEGPRRFRWIAAAICVVALGSILLAAVRLRRPPHAPAPWQFTRMTSSEENAGSPALSGDGKLLAYSLQKDGEQDLYIKQVAGGQPIRLTFDGAGNTSPDFSPDGTRIVFRSERDGGGVYQIAAFGGEARLLAHDGHNPKYSPDGSRVAFWIGDLAVAAAVPGNGTVWIVSSEGGLPRRIGKKFSTARLPDWSSDGRHLLILGYRSEKAYEISMLDRWVVTAGEGENAVQTGFREALLSAGLSPPESTLTSSFQAGTVFPEVCWVGNRLVFTARSGDSRNLWQTGISPAGTVSRDFQRLTAGAVDDASAFCTASGNLVFARMETAGTVWSLPFDLNRGKPAGPPEAIVREPSAMREGPSISADGKRVAFVSNQSGLLSIWWHDDAVGREIQVAPSRYVQRYPSVSPSGNRVAYSSYEDGQRILYVANPGGVPEKLCEGCLRATDWSSDEKSLLTFGGDPYRISLLDLASHQQTPLLTDPAFSLLYGRFSPNRHWISFTLRVTPNLSRIMIAPLDGPRPVPKSSWIMISEEGPQDSARWSPDGKTLYFTSGRDGHICLWGQRIDANLHRPSGPPFALQHFHERPMQMLRLWSARGNRIAVVLTEQTSAIWMMSRPDTR